MKSLIKILPLLFVTCSVLALTACKDQAAKDREESIAYHKKVMSYHGPMPPVSGGGDTY